MKTVKRILVTFIFCLSAVNALAQSPAETSTSANDTIIDLMESEILDTVSLDRPIHFTTPETTDIVLQPGSYQIMESDSNQLKFLSLDGNRTVVVSALSTHHQENVAAPIALHVRDDEKFPHLLLLLPDGRALEAVGSYDAMRSRSVRSFQLTHRQVLEALKKKLPKK